MINELINMNGYGIYVWSSFIFTFSCFAGLYLIIKSQLEKEQNKFRLKYSDLDVVKSETIKRQSTYRELSLIHI